MQLTVQSVRISQNEPNFCSRLEELTVLMWEFRDSQRGASNSSTRTVADQACAFESRQSRSGETIATFRWI
jgi:hypothetical protein